MKLLSSRKDCLSFLLFCIDRVVVVVFDCPAGGGGGLPVMISPASAPPPPPPPPPPPAARTGTAADAATSTRESANGAMKPVIGLVMPHSCFASAPAAS